MNAGQRRREAKRMKRRMRGELKRKLKRRGVERKSADDRMMRAKFLANLEAQRRKAEEARAAEEKRKLHTFWGFIRHLFRLLTGRK